MRIDRILYRILCGGLALGMSSCRVGDGTTDGDVKTELETLAVDETARIKLVGHAASLATIGDAEAFVNNHSADLLGIITSSKINSEENKNPTLFRVNAIKRARQEARTRFVRTMSSRIKGLLTAFNDGKTADLSPLDRYLIAEAKKVMTPDGRTDVASDSELRKILSARGIGTQRFDNDCKALSYYFMTGFSDEKIFCDQNTVYMLSIFSPARFEFAGRLWLGGKDGAKQPAPQSMAGSFGSIKNPQNLFGYSFATFGETPIMIAFGQGAANSTSRSSRSNAATKAKLEALNAMKNAYADAAISAEMAKYLKLQPQQADDFDAKIADLEKQYAAMVIKGAQELVSKEYKMSSGGIFSFKIYAWRPESK